jgi:hypothetical protein
MVYRRKAIRMLDGWLRAGRQDRRAYDVAIR